MKQDSIIKNKPLLTQSKLFKEVSSVIGKVAALEELTLAYREYSPSVMCVGFDWGDPLGCAFEWRGTPQGAAFWGSVYEGLPNE